MSELDRQDAIRSLVMSAHQLGRIAALTTGDATPVAQWRTLSILSQEGPLRVGELAALSRVTQPGMTRLLSTLSEEELIARIVDSTDSRAWLVRLTPKGEAAIADWEHRLGEALLPLFDGLGDDDWNTLERAAELIAEGTRPLVPSH